MTIVFKSLVYSHIDYALPIWGAVSNANLRRCHNTITHFLKCLFVKGYSFNCRRNDNILRANKKKKFDDYYKLYEKLSCLTVFERHTYVTVLFTRSLLDHQDILDCFNRVLRPASQSQRSFRSNVLRVPSGSSFINDSFLFRAAKLWNMLPNKVKSLGNASFKFELNRWLVENRNSPSVVF